MPRFAANVSTMFTEVPLLQRFERAARAGFTAVEMQMPYEAPAQALREQLDACGLTLVLHNLPPGGRTGDRGIACHPGREEEFRADVARGIEYARVLGAPQLHCMSGIAPVGVAEDILRRTWLHNLRHAAAEFKSAGLRLLIEPINTFDVPGYWLNRTAQALSLLDELAASGVDNAFVQYDLYHAQRSEGELAATLSRQLARIGHIQIADNPGRHEPGSGEVNWPFLFEHLDRIGYGGWVGCEYIPANHTEAGLGWMTGHHRR